MSERIRIDFDVNAEELKEITQAINILDRFNKQASTVTGALGALSGSMNNNGKAVKDQASEYVNLDKAMNAWASRLKNNQSSMSSLEASQAKLTEKLSKYGRDVKVSVDQNGKLAASFKNAEGNIVSMTGKYDAATNSIASMKTKLNTVANEVQKKAEADRKAVKEMDAMHSAALKTNKALDEQKRKYTELTRGTDLSRVLKANGGAFDVMNTAIKANSTIVRGSIDRNGKFTQALKAQDGTLITVSGYYDKVNKKLIQYSESMSKSEKATSRASKAMNNLNSQNPTGKLEQSMKGLNKYTLSWADAIEIAGTRMLQWNIAGSVIFGIQRAFKLLLSTIIEVDTQMVQLQRVMSEDTNFNEMMDDAVRLSTQLGRSLTEVNEAMITFARSGFDNVDTRYLSEAATLMANVSDISVFEGSESLTSAITLFNVKARDSIQIVNKLNEVDNNYSISTQQLANSLAKAGGTAAAFGVEMDDLLGHTTAIGVATRESGQIIGNSLKTIYSRINTLPAAAGALEKLGIATKDYAGDNRKVADQLNDLAKIWPTLTSAQQQNTAKTLAGTHQLSRFLAMMNNYQMGLDATKTAQNSYNSAVKENEKYMDSIQAKIKLVTSAFSQLAIALGRAGIVAAIMVTLDALNNLALGFTAVVDALGGWTFTIPVVAASVVALAYTFQRTREKMLAFQLAALSMNTSMSRTAFSMTATAGATTVMGAALGTLRNAIVGVTMAALTNPFTWIAVALTAIPMLIGHFQKLKAEAEALHQQADDVNKSFKDFKAEMAKGDVNQTSLDTYKSKSEVAGKALKALKKDQEDFKLTQEALEVSMKYSYDGGIGAMQVYGNWQKNISDKTKEELADIGIKYDKYDSFGALMGAVEKKQKSYSNAVELGNSILKESEKQLMFNAEAFEEVGEAVTNTMDLMESFFGVNDAMIKEMTDSYNAIMVLTKVKDKDAAQTEVLEQAYAVWEARLGLTREELLKNPSAMKENIKWQLEMKDKWGESTQEILTYEEQKALAADIATRRVKENAEEQTAAEKQAATEKASAAREASKEMSDAFTDQRKAMILTKDTNTILTATQVGGDSKRSNSTKSTSKSVTDALSKERGGSKSTTTAYGNLSNMQNQYNGIRQSKQSTTSTNVKKNLEGEREKAINTGLGFRKLGEDAASGNSKVSSTTAASATKTKSNLGTIIEKVSKLASSWKDIISLFSNPVVGVAKLSIKGVVDWFGGQGGGTDGLKDLVASSSAGGAGFAGTTRTSGFGYRKDPFTGAMKFHNGIDFAGPVGTPIKANTGGRVIYSGFGQRGSGYGGYGNVVAIQDMQGLTHLYAHNSANYVRTGSMVGAGQTIAAMGSTGNSTGSHSHYEVRSGGRAINPAPFLGGRGGGTDPLKDLMKFHSGGVVSTPGYQPYSPSRRNNEVDVRVLKGEMILTKQQQKQIFGLAGKNTPMHKYHTGGVVGKGAFANGGSYSGMGGGGSYTVKNGDTLSEIAQKFKTTVKSLMGLNKSIKNADKIFKGQVIKIGKSTTTTSKTKVTTPAQTAAAKAAKEALAKSSAAKREKNDAAAQKVMDYVSYMQSMNAKGYDTGKYLYNKMQDKRTIYAGANTATKKDYNKNIVEALNKYTDLSTAKKDFNSAKFFDLTAQQKKAIWAGIEQTVSQNKISGNESYVSYMQGLGLRNDSTYRAKNLRDNRSSFEKGGLESQRQYNTEMNEALRNFTNVKDVKAALKSAKFIGLSATDLKALQESILAEVKANTIARTAENQATWLEGFNKKYKEASDNVKEWIDLNNRVIDQNKELKKDNYIDSYVEKTLSKLNGEELTPVEKMQNQLDKMRSEIEMRAKQNAEIQYSGDPSKARMAELKSYQKELEARVAAAKVTSSNRGLNAKETAQAIEELTDRLAEVKKEYTELDNATKGNAAALKENEGIIGNLTGEYNKLQKELEETTKKTELLEKIKSKISSIFDWDSSSLFTQKTDEFGNTVRDIEGTIRSVLDVQAAIKDITKEIYENIDKTVEEMITSILTSELPNIGDIFNTDSDYSGIADGISGAINTIRPAWDDTLGYMSSSMMDVFNSTNWTSAMEKWTRDMAMSIEGLEPLFQGMLVKFPEVISNIMTELPNLVSVAMQNITVGVFNTVVEVLNRLVATVNQIVPAGDRVPMFDQMKYATPTYTQNNENTTNKEQKVYQTGGVEKNVTYIINTGVTLASESELREFAMLLKQMMDEEEGRSS